MIVLISILFTFLMGLTIFESLRNWFKNPKHIEIIAILIAAIIILAINTHTNNAGSNNYSWLADAWLHGHPWIYFQGAYIDSIPYNGHQYIIEAPFPAVLTIPFVLLWGPISASQLIPSLLSGLACITFLWLLLVRIGLNSLQRIALCSFLFLGTDLMWCAHLGDVWFFSPVVAVACTLLALLECTGKRRGWLIGLAAICAFESRSILAPTLFLLYPYLIMSGGLVFDNKYIMENVMDMLRSLRSYAIVIGLGLVFYVFYNYIRWGTFSDIGYQLFCSQDTACYHTPFGFQYLIYEVYNFFFRSFDLAQTGVSQLTAFPYFRISPQGLSLLFCSPALIAAFWAKRNWTVVILWVTTILILIPELLYYIDGWQQIGMRHALDFEPFLILLMAFALKNNSRKWFYGLIIWSIVIGMYGVWYWDNGYFYK